MPVAVTFARRYQRGPLLLAAPPPLAAVSAGPASPLPDPGPCLLVRPAAEVAAAAPPPAACLAATEGRGVRNVSLAITMPIAAHSTASAISWVPVSRLPSGPTSAAGAGGPERAGGCADGLGVRARIDGNSEPASPAALDAAGPPVTSGSNPG
jgi:hypothetical protein